MDTYIIYIIGLIIGPRHVFLPHPRHENVAIWPRMLEAYQSHVHGAAASDERVAEAAPELAYDKIQEHAEQRPDTRPHCGTMEP